ncbi:MAG: hypothetical protein CSA38_01205 [Flavobacteriales bacterium]|nr:MAG: hypothetical protein CSA38_01205 [Flavobacteriales bacterium]
MKKLIYITLLTLGASCTAQTYPLRTYGEMPQNSYLKDTNNELQDYEGTWKASWKNKTIFITFTKLEHIYVWPLKQYKDRLIGKFKVIDKNTNQVLFDNTNISDTDAKIKGGGIKKNTNKYLLSYGDKDLCGLNGLIFIEFTDSTKTKLNWKFSYWSNMITQDCPYFYAEKFPEPLPKNAVLVKQN